MRPPARERSASAPATRPGGWAWGSPALTRLCLAVLATGLVAVLAVVSDNFLPTNLTAAVGPYNFPFTLGKPAAPTPWNPATWDVAVHIRNNYQYGGIDAMQAGHGPTCGAPPATHPISTYQDAVFMCNNHVMTAINAGGYGAIYLTPDHMFDWSHGTSVLDFPVSTFRTSDRDWIDLWITPFGENMELPLQTWLPDLQGPPKDALHITMSEFNQGTIFTAETYNNFQSSGLPGNWWTTLESLMPASALTRTTFELQLSQNHLRFGIPILPNAQSFYWIDTGISLGFTSGVVQLGHHSYTPDKSAGCGPPVEQKALGLTCAPNTWHWGGLSMTSAVPFTLIRANDRVITPGVATSTTFSVPAPANSFLRFAGVGTLSVSFDGGKTWVTPQTQQESKHVFGEFENYWQPIPQGTTKVVFRGQNWYGGPWFARDLSIFSQNLTGVAPNPPSTPAATPGSGGGPPPSPSPAPHVAPMIAGGINAEPSMRPWRYVGANPDGWWCVPPNCNQNPNPLTTVQMELALAKRLGVANVRIEFPWALIEPQRGVYDWTRADAIVNAANSAGVQLQPVLVFTPSWAAGGATLAPAASDFGAFVSAIVGRYHTSIHYWEMWNEPDHTHYWNSGEAAYVQDIVIPGYTAAKAVDPKAHVILAGPSVWSGGWFNGVFAAGGGSSFDIVAYHDYGGSPQQTAFNVQSAEQAHSGKWPIWLGEYGVQEGAVADTQQQALMIAVLTSSAPLAMAQWYNIRDDFSMTCCPPQVAVTGSWGLVMHNDTTMKNGFATMQALLAGTFSGTAPAPSSGPEGSSGPKPTPSGDAAPPPAPAGAPEGGNGGSPSPTPPAIPSPSASPRR